VLRFTATARQRAVHANGSGPAVSLAA